MKEKLTEIQKNDLVENRQKKKWTNLSQLSPRLILWVISEPNQRNSPNPQIPIGIVWKRVGCVLGIEPNEHQISVFRGNTAITRICQKTLRDPILPMFSLYLSDVEVWVSSIQWNSVFLWGIGENDGIEMRILWTSLNQHGGERWIWARSLLQSIAPSFLSINRIGSKLGILFSTWTGQPKKCSEHPCYVFFFLHRDAYQL